MGISGCRGVAAVGVLLCAAGGIVMSRMAWFSVSATTRFPFGKVAILGTEKSAAEWNTFLSEETLRKGEGWAGFFPGCTKICGDFFPVLILISSLRS
jgi:hypothetical protein